MLLVNLLLLKYPILRYIFIKDRKKSLTRKATDYFPLHCINNAPIINERTWRWTGVGGTLLRLCFVNSLSLDGDKFKTALGQMICKFFTDEIPNNNHGVIYKPACHLRIIMELVISRITSKLSSSSSATKNNFWSMRFMNIYLKSFIFPSDLTCIVYILCHLVSQQWYSSRILSLRRLRRIVLAKINFGLRCADETKFVIP